MSDFPPPVDGSGATEALLSLPPSEESETMDIETLRAALAAEQAAVRDHLTAAFNHITRVGQFADQLAAALPAAGPPYTPTVKNQAVLDAVGRVGKAVGQNLVGQMPNDLLDKMVANRQAPYVGPPLQGWGLTDEQKAQVVADLRSRAGG